jgi:hypothetical protein
MKWHPCRLIRRWLSEGQDAKWKPTGLRLVQSEPYDEAKAVAGYYKSLTLNERGRPYGRAPR